MNNLIDYAINKTANTIILAENACENEEYLCTVCELKIVYYPKKRGFKHRELKQQKKCMNVLKKKCEGYRKIFKPFKKKYNLEIQCENAGCYENIAEPFAITKQCAYNIIVYNLRNPPLDLCLKSGTPNFIKLLKCEFHKEKNTPVFNTQASILQPDITSNATLFREKAEQTENEALEKIKNARQMLNAAEFALTNATLQRIKAQNEEEVAHRVVIEQTELEHCIVVEQAEKKAKLERCVVEQAEKKAKLERCVVEQAKEQADLKRRVTEQAEEQADLERRVAEQAQEQADLERCVAEQAQEQADLERRVAEQANLKRHVAEQADLERRVAEQAQEQANLERHVAEQAKEKRQKNKLKNEKSKKAKLERDVKKTEVERCKAEQAEVERCKAEQAELERCKAKQAELEQTQRFEANAKQFITSLQFSTHGGKVSMLCANTHTLPSIILPCMKTSFGVQETGRPNKNLDLIVTNLALRRLLDFISNRLFQFVQTNCIGVYGTNMSLDILKSRFKHLIVKETVYPYIRIKIALTQRVSRIGVITTPTEVSTIRSGDYVKVTAEMAPYVFCNNDSGNNYFGISCTCTNIFLYGREQTDTILHQNDVNLIPHIY